MIIFIFAIIKVCVDILLGNHLDDRYAEYIIAGSFELILFDLFLVIMLFHE